MYTDAFSFVLNMLMSLTPGFWNSSIFDPMAHFHQLCPDIFSCAITVILAFELSVALKINAH